jgi:hypothetical protein
MQLATQLIPSAQEHTAWSFVFAVVGALTVFLKVYSFFVMFLQTFVISGKSVRVFIYHPGGPQLTPVHLQQLKKWGARRGAYAGMEHPVVYIVHY